MHGDWLQQQVVQEEQQELRKQVRTQLVRQATPTRLLRRLHPSVSEPQRAVSIVDRLDIISAPACTEI